MRIITYKLQQKYHSASSYGVSNNGKLIYWNSCPYKSKSCSPTKNSARLSCNSPSHSPSMTSPRRLYRIRRRSSTRTTRISLTVFRFSTLHILHSMSHILNLCMYIHVHMCLLYMVIFAHIIYMYVLFAV